MVVILFVECSIINNMRDYELNEFIKVGPGLSMHKDLQYLDSRGHHV